MTSNSFEFLQGLDPKDLDLLRRSALFDARWYRDNYPDVTASGMDPAEHYLRFAAYLKRDPSPVFDAQAYLDANPSAAAEGSNPLLHYIRHGGTTGNRFARHTGDEMQEATLGKTLNAPHRLRADGRRLLTRSHNRGHFWYDNHALRGLLAEADTITKLPQGVGRLLVIAHDFKLLTGCSRSLSHYLNAMSALGGCDLNSIELGPEAHASVAQNFVDTHDFVIVNSISPFFSNEGMVDLVRECGPGRAAVYLHETEWVFEKLKGLQPARFREFVAALPEMNILCVSHKQQEWLRREYGVENSIVIHEATTLLRPPPDNDFSLEDQGETTETGVAPAPKVAAILHLYYHDLWPEIQKTLLSLSDTPFDLYVTLCSEHPRGDLDEITRTIRKTHDQAIILEFPNRGMDIGPFVEVINHIASADKSYDLFVKVHTKKSLAASGREVGEAWRKQLFGALLGSCRHVEEILRLFREHPEIGMIGPKGRMIGSSRLDMREQRNVNQPKMNALAARMNVRDTSLEFFAGSMFWSRYTPIANAVRNAGLSIDDFEAGHVSDASYAHAMERLFACIIRDDFQVLRQYAGTNEEIGLSGQPAPGEDGRKTVRILMAGTIQPRKGTTLFSHVADMAKRAGLPWDFYWAGQKVSDDVYMSEHVNWLGNLDSAAMFEQLTRCDIFLLSSEDDPFPLCVLEALQARKRVVVYNRTGVSELFDGSNDAPGIVFDDFTPGAVMVALRKAAFFDVDPIGFDRINDHLSLTSFVSRLNEAIGKIYEAATPVSSTRLQTPGAVFVNIASADAWPQLRFALTNLCASNTEVGIFIPPERKTDLNTLAEEITTRIPRARILSSTDRSGSTFAAALSGFAKSLADDRKWVLVLNATADVSADIPMLASPLEVERSMALVNEGRSSQAVISHARECGPDAGYAFLASPQKLRDLTDIMKQQAKPAWTASDFAGWVNTKALHYDPEIPLPVTLLKNRHLGEDIYIAASGPSTGFLDPTFFEGKCVIGVNRVFHHVPCQYLVFKEFPGRALARELEMLDITPVVARGDSGDLEQGRWLRNQSFFTDRRTVFFDHCENGLTNVKVSAIGSEDKLVVSYSSITSAMHLAAYMGARNIMLMGHDCGLIDGQATLAGYNNDLTQTPWNHKSEYEEWLSQIEAQTLLVKKTLKRVYGANVVSINPFVNFGLEGHIYSRGSVPSRSA